MKKIKWVVCLIVAFCLACGVAFTGCTIGEKEAHEHDLTHVTGNDATELEDGNIEYWYCEGCGKYFSDADATTEITQASTVISATGEHSITHVEAKAATELEEGNIEYWYCNDCGKYFSDAEATTEITENDIAIAATGEHTLVHVEAKEATTAAEGNTEYWYCSGCGKYFSDAEGATEITDKTSVIIPKLATPVTISIVTPSSVTASLSSDASTDYTLSNDVLSGFNTGDTITESAIEGIISLNDSNTGTGILGTREFVGWYVKDVAADGSVTTTVLDSTGYTLASETAIIAPYYKDINGANDIVVNNAPKSGGIQISDEGLNGIAANGHPCTQNGDSTVWDDNYHVVSRQSNTVIVEPSTEGGYAQLGTNVFTYNDHTIGGEEDYFRLTTTHDSFTASNDNVFLYRIQNYGSDSIYLTATLVNKGVTPETNLVNVFLAAGDSIDLVYSVEFSNFSDDNNHSNTSTMIVLRGTSVSKDYTLDIGVTTAMIAGSDESTAGTTVNLSDMETAGYTTGVADIDSAAGTEASASNFVAVATTCTTITDAGKINISSTTTDEGNGEDNSGENNSGENGGDVEEKTAATVTVKMPSTVSIDSNASYSNENYNSETKTISGYSVGDTISTSALPSSEQLADSNDATGYLSPRTMVGWYAKETVDGVIKTSVIGDSGYTIQTETVTVAPYYSGYNGATPLVVNGGSSTDFSNSSFSSTSYYNWKALSTYCSFANKTSNGYQAIATNTENDVIVEPASDGGYAMLGTHAVTTGVSITSGDYFRLTTSHTTASYEDNVQVYRFQNYGTDTVYFTAFLCNSETHRETNDVNIYLAPGDSCEVVFSVEYLKYGSSSSNSYSNGNAMMMLRAPSDVSYSAFTMDIGVSLTITDGSSSDADNTTNSGVTEGISNLYTDLSALSSTWKVNKGNYDSSADASGTNMIASLTNSTIDGAGAITIATEDTFYVTTTTTSLAIASITVEGSAGADTQTSSGSDD